MQFQNPQLQREKKNISKYAGLLAGRILLLGFLFCLIPFMTPVAAYLFFFFLLFPWILSGILSGRATKKYQPLLESCSKKFHYTPYHYRAEVLTRNIILFSLLLWQVTLNQTSAYSALLTLAPVFLLIAYLLCKTICSIVVRQKIHQYYFQLKGL